MTDIAVSVSSDGWAALPDAEALAARAALAALGGDGLKLPEGTELDIELADDEAVQALNRDYRSKDKPTNVLSFPACDGRADIESAAAQASGDGPPLHLGGIILAAETVAREAQEQGKTLADHTTHLVVHGVLHLVGHDHELDAEAEEMEALERRILLGMGVPDPYLSDGSCLSPIKFPDIV